MSAVRAQLDEAVAKAFREGSTASGSRRQITIIREGWGSSGYYPGKVLERDIPRIFPVGTQMYLNHPTKEEDQMRPERDLRDLVGKVVETPRMAGIESISVAEVFDHWQPTIDAIAGDCGLSIRAFGAVEEGSAGGKTGPIVQSLSEGVSIDYVTKAGAGGAVGPLIEEARTHAPSYEDQAVAAFNAILESAGKPAIDPVLLKEVLKTPALGDLFEEADKLADSINWDKLAEAESLFNQFLEREVPDAERITLAKKGHAIPLKDSAGNIIGGRFPMRGSEDVRAAAMALGSRDGGIQSFINKVAEDLSCPVPFKEAAPPQKPKEKTMADATLESLQESMKTLQDQVETNKKESETKIKEAEDRATRAEGQLLKQKAAGVVARVVNAKENLDTKVKTRVVESTMARDLPMDGTGGLDEGALEERARNEIRKELEYLGMIDESTGKVKDHGSSFLRESGDDTQTDADTKALEESFKRNGMSEEAAKIAAEGR